MLHPFITKIQGSDEATKKRWLVIFSAVASLIVLGVWFLNLTLIFSGGEDQPVAQSTEIETETPSSWNQLTASIYTATQDLKNGISRSLSSIKEGVSSPHEVNVEVE